MNKAKQVFQKEYLRHKQKPLLIKLNGKEYVIPYAYLQRNPDNQLAKDYFIDDFFDAQQKDLSLYEKNKIEPKEVEWTDGKTKYTFFVPFALKDKNLSNSEIVSAIFKKAEQKYKKAASNVYRLQKAYPDSKETHGISAADVKSMQKKYRTYLWNKTKDKTKYGALVVGEFISKGVKAGARGIQLGAGKIVELTPEKFKRVAKRYALITLVGGASMTGSFYALRSTLSLPKHKITENVVPDTTKKVSVVEAAVLQMESIEEQVPKQEIKTTPKTKKEIAAHNKQVFLENLNEIKATLCFMENFSDKTYLDGNGVPTIGYGSTYFIDEKGKGDWSNSKVKKGMEISLKEADVQKERYLKFKVLPQMMEDVNVPLSAEEMIASSSFAYNVGPGGFRRSEYLKALNKGIKGKNLARCMFAAKKNNLGLVKRNLFAYYIMQKKVKVSDLLNMRAEGCYSLELYDCCATQGKGIKWEKDGLATFREDNIAANIAKAKKKRISKLGPCKLVREILPAKVVKSVLEKAKQKQAQAQFNMALMRTDNVH